MSLDPRRVGEAVRDACLTELRALKPGNVHVYGAGHGMTVADFESSAAAIAPVFARPGLNVGARVRAAVEATRAAVGCNTNLGIILLAAPLAEAALSDREGSLRRRLDGVLAALTVADAGQVFQAIRLAEPAGLGRSDRHDVHEPARATLREAMAEAASRDLAARQYATCYADVFDRGLARLRSARLKWGDEAWAAASVYLDFLAAFPDSHIARKFGADRAEDVRRRAVEPLARLDAAADPETQRNPLMRFDAALKAEGLNPGTCADLTVASLLAARLERLIVDEKPA